jgi:hypothetical protein
MAATPATWQQCRPVLVARPLAAKSNPWADSLWFTLAISLCVGFVYALVLMGPALNPRNTGWMIGDQAMYYTGWELFRQDPQWHWPLTHTDRVGYPVGENVALLDLDPLLAVVFKLFSPLLPEPFQYFGFEAVLVLALQLFFSVRLFRLVLGGENPVGAWLCSLFLLFAPPLTFNATFHFAHSNHWLLIAALLVYFQAQQEQPNTIRRFVISAIVLAGVAIATNPYLAFQVLLVLTATVGSLLWQRRLSLARAAVVMAALGATAMLVVFSFGLFISEGRGYSALGYRMFALNLLAPFDPYIYGAILRRLLHYFPVETQTYPGCSYLGAGVIFLGILLLILFALRPAKRPRLDRRWWLPLGACCLLLTLMALSTRVMLGSVTLVDVDPRQHLTRFLSPLRMSVYLFLVPYYTILTALVAATFLFFRRRAAYMLLAAVLVVQLVDLAPLRSWAHARVIPSEQHGFWKPPQRQPLQSSIWSSLGAVHQNLVVLPAWQCGGNATPGGLDGFRIFGLLAVAQKMRINSYYSGRYSEASRDFHCKQAPASLTTQPLSPDTAYVVTPALADVIARGPTGPGKCHTVNGFILCSSRIDFGW